MSGVSAERAAGAELAVGAERAQWEARLGRHAALRWVGIGLFVVGVGVLGWHIALLVSAGLPWARAVPCLLGMGLSLGAFGANDDSVLVAMDRLDRLGALPARFRAELSRERAARPKRIATAHLSPKAAVVLPLCALGLLGWLSVRAYTWLPPSGAAPSAQPAVGRAESLP